MGKKLSLLEQPIHTYAPTEKGRMCIAMIGNHNMIFKDHTVEAVRARADAWRHEEVAKVKAAKARRAEQQALSKAKKEEANA